MRHDDLPIEDPCPAPWDEMTGDERRRHCAACQKDVHDVSALTKQEAQAFLKAHNDKEICVRYAHDPDGQILFKPSDSERLEVQRRGLRSLLAASALAILPMGDCGSMEDFFKPEPPIELNMDLVRTGVVFVRMDEESLQKPDRLVAPASGTLLAQDVAQTARQKARMINLVDRVQNRTIMGILKSDALPKSTLEDLFADVPKEDEKTAPKGEGESQ